MDRIDVAVIGAGVVGLAIARALACAGRSVVVLEKQADFGTGTSARNSEVIHAGLHYPPGSLKERLCIAGKRQLYAFCASHQVPHRQIGKLTVATSADEVPRLEALADHARAAGADEGLAWLDAHEALRLEPALACAAALHSPSSGIVDASAFMRSLLGEAQDHGAVLARAAPATRITRAASGWQVTSGDDAIACDAVVNAAGLDAPDVATLVEGFDPAALPALYPTKGNYFACTGKVPFSHLIYPLPVPGGLGIHLTLDLGRQARFGPDVEPLQDRDYTVDPARRGTFTQAARRFWPDLVEDRLVPAFAGIRPALSPPGSPPADFRIDGEAIHGQPGLVNLFGIDSPGLTASLAIADHVASLLYGA